MEKNKVVVVGGGTGTHTALRGLRPFSDKLDITAVVSMADDGGSTGRLRDEFGQLPVGDIRNALTALASDGDEHNQLLRQLFSYRFQKGSGLSGHNFGNIFITALSDILGDEVKAIEAVSKILRIAGRVLPVTTDNVHLVAEYADGTKIIGEHKIDEPEHNDELRITDLYLEPEGKIAKKAKKALLEADLIMLGPGDLYTSVLANCVVSGFSETLKASQAKIIYVCNLMSKKGQTVGMNAKEHIDEIIKYTGITPFGVVVNSTIFPRELLKKYAGEGDFPILNNCRDNSGYKVYSRPLASENESEKVKGDVIKRSLIRHNPDLLAQVVLDILSE